MNDPYMLQKIQITPEIGLLLRLFRIAKDVQSKTLADKLNKSASYFTKLEQGLIKSIDTNTFVSICNQISDSERGVENFLYAAREIKISSNGSTREFKAETELSLRNINDCVVARTVPFELRKLLLDRLDKYNISFNALIAQINQNENTFNVTNYDTLPTNQWILVDSNNLTFENQLSIFKKHIQADYLTAILNGSQNTTYKYVLDIILASITDLANDEELTGEFINLPARFGFPKFDFSKPGAITPNNVYDIDKFDPKIKPIVRDIIGSFKFLSANSPDHCIAGLSKLSHNLINDPGFAYAYLNTDLSPLKDLPREQKQQFLNDVRDLVKKYSEQEPEVELFD